MILNIADILSERALEIERALEGCFDPSDTSTLTEAMRSSAEVNGYAHF